MYKEDALHVECRLKIKMKTPKVMESLPYLYTITEGQDNQCQKKETACCNTKESLLARINHNHCGIQSC